MQLHLLEAKLAVNPTKRTLRDILAIRCKLKALYLGRVNKIVLVGHRFYVRANKTYTLLAKMFSDNTDHRTPHLLQNNTSTIIHDSESFMLFFSKL